MTKKVVLLIGPNIGNDKSYYGAGIGGYTRNMTLYLEEFQFDNISLVPFYHTTRKKKEFKIVSFPMRFFKDSFGLLRSLIFNNIDAIHILGQYRNAIPREVVWVFMATLFKIPVVYEIKAGMFIKASRNSKWHKNLAKYILRNSSVILIEGNIYKNYVFSMVNKNAVYFPNVVSPSEIPTRKLNKIHFPLKILFVGFCYKGKGIFDLVEAINSKKIDFDIELEIIGGESIEFVNWISNYPLRENVKIIRYGPQSHDFVLKKMKNNTVYVYPSKHPGEGHNNTINEALMNSMIIISSKAGFLEDVLSNSAFLIDSNKDTVDSIVNSILEIIKNPEKALKMARDGRYKIETIYNSEIQKKVLEYEYKKILKLS